jgi:hypothetical protein
MPKWKKPKGSGSTKESGTARQRNNKTAILGKITAKAKRLLNESREVGQ